MQSSAARPPKPAVQQGAAPLQRTRKRCTSPSPPGLYGKRRRCLSPIGTPNFGHVSPGGPLTPREPVNAEANHPASPATTDDVMHLGSSSQLSDPVVTAPDKSVPPPSDPESAPHVSHQLPKNLSVYSHNDISAPQILLLGDSIIRGVKLPAGVTYCLNDGKAADFISLLPKLIGLHPTVTIVILHFGTNYVMDRSSAKLHQETEELCLKVESLGKRCLLSGPIPSLLRGSEYFSRLYGFHQWLRNFCIAAGFNFISHFDSFWSRKDLFDNDLFHPNRNGVRKLTFNFLNCIAFDCL